MPRIFLRATSFKSIFHQNLEIYIDFSSFKFCWGAGRTAYKPNTLNAHVSSVS